MVLQMSDKNAVGGLEAALSFASEEKVFCEEMSTAKAGKTSAKCDDYSSDLLAADGKYADSGSDLTCKRRRLQKNSVVILSVEAETNERPASTEKRGLTGSPAKSTKSLDGISKLEPVTVCEQRRSTWVNAGGVVSVISEIDFNDDTEYSISNLSDLESSRKDHLANHVPFSTLRSRELQVLGIGGGSSSTQQCKLCGHSENILNMLICDNCEEAFHASCCTPRIMILPIDEWFCHHCTEKKSKVSLETTFLKSPCISLEKKISKFHSGPIAFMLKYPEKHTSRVRIGKAFQVEVPDWCGPISKKQSLAFVAEAKMVPQMSDKSAVGGLEAALSFASKEKEFCEEMSPGNAGKRSTKCDDYSSDLLAADSKYADSGPDLTCKRRRLQKNSVVILSVEAETNEGPASTAKKGITGSPAKCTKSLDGTSKLEPVTVCEEHRSTWVNPGGVVSVIPEIDFNENTEHSISNLSDLESSRKDHLVKHVPFSTLRSRELLLVLGIGGGSGSTQQCKLCGHSENILNMLICDNCEEAFHASCCTPWIKILPIDEWLCHHCAKKKSKVSLETTILRSRCISLEKKISKFHSGPIAFMLKYPEKHTSRVRIGKAFQAEVPDWCGAVSNDTDFIDEPFEMDPSETTALHVNTDELPKPNILGNWLQCQAALHDESGKSLKGAICGKWRRAPSFEVQTDDWDCSCSVRWDPIHSDCAVPQELETDEVVAQLKCIEMVKPRLRKKK